MVEREELHVSMHLMKDGRLFKDSVAIFYEWI